MLLSAARRFFELRIILHAGVRIGLAGIALLGANNSLQNAIAEGDTRTLSFHHLHTGEDITITFKRNGRYDDAALKKLDWFMRDWRKQESIRMDPHLFDVLWETYREVGANQAIQVVCGYRSPATNAMLRARSSGVAQFSQHTLGHAMDFFIPGVPLEKVREIGLRLQRGGVGFYPTSGSPFVHMDTGTIRHWPRMTYAQLAKVFPDGRTVHVPADGHPLPRYAQALAEVQRRGKTPNSNSLETARAAGIISADQEQQAVANAQTNAQEPQHNLLADLFGFLKPKNTDETEDEQTASIPAPTSAHTKAAVAGLTPTVPLPVTRPHKTVTAMQQPQPSNSNSALVGRGIWPDPIEKNANGAGASQSPFDVAAADPIGTDRILSYSATSEPARTPRIRPMGTKASRQAPTHALPVFNQPTATAKPQSAPAMMSGGQSLDSPWTLATMLTPSISGFMTATRLGHVDMRPLAELLIKPSQSVAMTFSPDPASDMLADRFTGPAVVFLATTSFVRQTTASLR